MLRRLPAWSTRSTSDLAAASRRRIIIVDIIAVPIIMVLLALLSIMAAFITAITAMPIIMAVFIIAIIAVSLAVPIAGHIIKPVLSGITFVATAVGGIDEEAPGSRLWCFFLSSSALRN
jgi:hypothetical protein